MGQLPKEGTLSAALSDNLMMPEHQVGEAASVPAWKKPRYFNHSLNPYVCYIGCPIWRPILTIIASFINNTRAIGLFLISLHLCMLH